MNDFGGRVLAALVVEDRGDLGPGGARASLSNSKFRLPPS
jgi:hypothetical protein